ncbi:MAG: hypothetical protein ACRET2_03855, partial [Steroidobacteraceae bacterium]
MKKGSSGEHGRKAAAIPADSAAAGSDAHAASTSPAAGSAGRPGESPPDALLSTLERFAGVRVWIVGD